MEMVGEGDRGSSRHLTFFGPLCSSLTHISIFISPEVHHLSTCSTASAS